MSDPSMQEWIDQGESVLDLDWETAIFQKGCALVRDLASRRLSALDDELMRSKPDGLRLVGFRERSLMTRFGDLEIKRRMYIDADGKEVFPLDECLGLKPGHRTSPSLTECIEDMSKLMPFPMVEGALSDLTAARVPRSMAHD